MVPAIWLLEYVWVLRQRLRQIATLFATVSPIELKPTLTQLKRISASKIEVFFALVETQSYPQKEPKKES
jgi:hypothetical protein